MNRTPLSAKELSVLEGVFWSHGPSRDALSVAARASRRPARMRWSPGLIEQGWLDEVGPARIVGRPARRDAATASRPRRAARCRDLGATSVEVAVLTPDLQVLARHGEPVDVRDGPGIVLSRMRTLMRELLAQCARQARAR